MNLITLIVLRYILIKWKLSLWNSNVFFKRKDSWGGIITDLITLHKYLYADCDPINKIDPSGYFSILGVMAGITITATIASIAIPVFTGIYLAIVNQVSILDYIAALCSEDVWIEAAIGIGIGTVVGMGIKAIAKKLSCNMLVFLGTIMSLWSLYQSINLSIDMINGGVSQDQVARYLAVLTATVILTTIIGRSGNKTGGSSSDDLVDVTRWGRPGLESGDWVMKGKNTWWNYLRSCKWQPGMGNQFSPKGAGEVFQVPGNTLKWPKGWGIDGWWKGLFGQRRYIP
jgi:hypothetical protein